MEVLERRGKVAALAVIVFILFWSQCKGVEGHKNSKMSYVCPPDFIRLGWSCYFFSENKATWQNALFACKDRDSNLTAPQRWEDRNLRKYLNQPTVERAPRWMGGIYDYSTKAWRWGGELRQMNYQSFSKMKKLQPEQLQWHCISMEPDLLYRWAPQSCIEPRQYICQTKIKKIPKSKVKDFKRRWQRMGKINEIEAPSVSRENDPATNDVTNNPRPNPKSFDLGRPSPLRVKPKNNARTTRNGLRPNDLHKRSKGPTVPRKITRPFPGYSWNRSDPEGSFKYNADLLRSGKTGLSQQQIKGHLARLTHLRNRQLTRNRRMRMRVHSDWLVNDRPSNDAPKERPLVQVHARTYTIDNKISALHPKMIVEELDMLPPPPAVRVQRNTRSHG